MWTGGLFWGVLGRMGRVKKPNVKTSHRDPPSAAARQAHSRTPVTAGACAERGGETERQWHLSDAVLGRAPHTSHRASTCVRRASLARCPVYAQCAMWRPAQIPFSCVDQARHRQTAARYQMHKRSDGWHAEP
eukprot:1698909-Prymnesium_polylepis.1